MSRAVLAALAALTAAALALRIPGIDQSLYGDEDFTYYIVVRHGIGGVWDAVYDTSVTPPLHYALAWLALKLGGDSTVLVRLPSLILGTALVPLVFLLARRVAAAPVALLAAALVAFSPFAIWYSDEARAYATMMFLVAASTLALLKVLRDGGRLWWALYAACACAAIWTHYTAVFAVATQALWALWARPERRRETTLALGAVALGYLPWLPGFLQQRRNEQGIATIEKFAEPSLSAALKFPLRTLVGHAEFGLAEFPGAAGLALAAIAVAALVALAAGVGADGVTRERAERLLRSDGGLIVLLAVATPIGLLAYGAVGSSLFLPRNIAASMPALAVLAALVLGCLLSRLGRLPAAVLAAVVLALLAVNAVKTLGDSWRRPAQREAVAYVERVSAAADPIVEVPPPLERDERIPALTLDRYADGARPVYRDPAPDAWRRLRAGGSVYVVAYDVLRPSRFTALNLPPGEELPADMARRMDRIGGPNGRALVSSRTVFPGLVNVDVTEYGDWIEGAIEGGGDREVLTWTLGARVPVRSGAARGAVDGVSRQGKSLVVSGWALAASRARPPDWVLLFAGRRLLAVSAGGGLRPDLVETYGAGARLAGFGFSLRGRQPLRLRVFAVVGDEASELPWSPAAERNRRTILSPRG